MQLFVAGEVAEERSMHTLKTEITGGAANFIRPSIDEVTHSADEKAKIEEGRVYDRERKQAGGAQGDWWRDEMASGTAVRRR